jgi:hypothetical protein
MLARIATPPEIVEPIIRSDIMAPISDDNLEEAEVDLLAM